MQTTDHSRLLRQLLDIGRQMAETRALDPLLMYAVDVTLELLNAQYGFIVLMKDDATLDFRVARDRQGNNIVHPETQISRTILYRVIEDGTLVRTASAITDEEFGRASSVEQLELKSVLCVPLISQGAAIGAIYLENRAQYGVFGPEDAEPLQYLASHTAVCIQNALLNEELESLAHQRIHVMTQESDARVDGDTAFEQAVERERTRILYNFIQDASHQFRTPLAVIKTAVDLLARKIDVDAFGNYLDRIRDQVDIVVRLVDSLNLLARLDAHIDRVFIASDLIRVAHEIWEVMRLRASHHEIDLQLVINQDNIPVQIQQEYARQAISKVVENAISFSSPGGTVTIEVDETEDAGIVAIIDHGIGISTDELPHVATRFYRGDRAGTTRGLGLGLSIAAKAMALHDGDLLFSSEPGEGTRVELVFPKSRGE